MRKLIRGLTSIVALAILAGVVLGFGGGLIFELDLLAHFRLHLLLLIPVVLAFALGTRAWVSLWRLVVAAVLALAGLAPVWETPGPSENGPALTIMTANLYQANRRPDEMRRALLQANADILVTNETAKSVQTGDPSLATLYPYRISLTTTGSILRTVIWSKLPMRDGRLYLEDQVEPTGASAIVEIAPGQEVSVLGLHFAHAVVGNQGRQIDALDRIAEGLPHPRIVMGDFNATPWSWAMQRIEILTGTRRVPGYRVTWHGRYPALFGTLRSPLGQPIDHILLSKDIRVLQIQRVFIPGSDHLGVLARIAIEDG